MRNVTTACARFCDNSRLLSSEPTISVCAEISIAIFGLSVSIFTKPCNDFSDSAVNSLLPNSKKILPIGIGLPIVGSLKFSVKVLLSTSACVENLCVLLR